MLIVWNRGRKERTSKTARLSHDYTHLHAQVDVKVGHITREAHGWRDPGRHVAASSQQMAVEQHAVNNDFDIAWDEITVSAATTTAKEG